MTPQEIEQMKADREAGTQGEFHVSKVRGGYAICDDRGATVGAAHRMPPRYDNAEQSANADRFARVPTLEAEILRLREALAHIDALDPESQIDGVSQHAMRGLVLRMGEIARAALNGDAP